MAASPPTATATAATSSAVPDFDTVVGPLFLVVIILLLAAAAIATIWWGSVLRRRRIAAERQVAEDFRIAEEHGATTDPVARVDPETTATVSADVPEAASGPVDPVPAEAAAAGDLAQIKGLGPKLVALLAEHNITHVAQLAALGPAEADALDAKLGAFRGRIARDRWVEQAKLLSSGDRTGYEAAFGKLGG